MINTTWGAPVKRTSDWKRRDARRVALWFIALIKEKPRCFEPWHHLYRRRFVASSSVSYELSLCESFIVHLCVAAEFWCELWDSCVWEGRRRHRAAVWRPLSFPPAWGNKPISSRRVPEGLPGSLDLAGLWRSEGPEASPSTSWKVLFCFPHMWWICMAASRSATRSRSCWAKWALSCLISNWKERRGWGPQSTIRKHVTWFREQPYMFIPWALPSPCLMDDTARADFWSYMYTDPVVPWPHTGLIRELTTPGQKATCQAILQLIWSVDSRHTVWVCRALTELQYSVELFLRLRTKSRSLFIVWLWVNCTDIMYTSMGILYPPEQTSVKV